MKSDSELNESDLETESYKTKQLICFYCFRGNLLLFRIRTENKSNRHPKSRRIPIPCSLPHRLP